MGNVAEQYFDIDECPFCKSKKLRAIVTSSQVFMCDDGEFWEDEMEFSEDKVEVICVKCGRKIEQGD